MTTHENTISASILAAPNCCYCDLPLDEVNDTDAETGGFYSSHFACTHATFDGRYTMATIRPDGSREVITGVDGRTMGFTTRRRAQAEADHYTRSNPQYAEADYLVRFHGRPEGTVHPGYGTRFEVEDRGSATGLAEDY